MKINNFILTQYIKILTLLMSYFIFFILIFQNLVYILYLQHISIQTSHILGVQ